MITNDPELARRAEDALVGRIFVDLEIIGKQDRQGHLDTLISDHSMEDVGRIGAILRRSELLVRLNPIHAGTADEVESAIAQGAQILMLPMFRTVAEVEEFCGLVDGRVRVVPLIETIGAAEAMPEVVEIPGVSEIYIGLNDLHLDMRLSFMFELLANGMVERLADIAKSVGLPFGFGGIARVGQGAVPGELVLAEHARLGSSSVVLSRTFSRELESGEDTTLAKEVEKLAKAFVHASHRNQGEIESDRNRLIDAVGKVIELKANEKAV